MTHTQTQGADGAGTNGTLWCMHIAGPDDVHAAPDFWTALAWSAELNAAVAARAIKQGWAGDDNWPLAQATVQRWPWSAEGHADSLATELAARAAQKPTPAPAATPGVPDSLRALSEAAPQGLWTVRSKCVFAPSTNPCIPGDDVVVSCAYSDRLHDDDDASLKLIAALVNWLRALIAAQPAGQAGDVLCADAARYNRGECCGGHACIDAAERQHAAEVELQEIQDGAYGNNPMTRGAARDRLDAMRAEPALECTGCGSRESIEAIQARGFVSCCPERKMQPAPNGTRTGAAETEREAEAPIYEAFARYVGNADERPDDFRMFATGYHAVVEALDRRVDGQVWRAAGFLDGKQKQQPDWLWFDSDDSRTSFGRWAKHAGQAPYVRADIALAARREAPSDAGGLATVIAAKTAEIGPIFLDMGKQRERPRIYIASKTAHAPRWRQLRADGLPVISTWIDEAGKGETGCFTDLWQRCVDEAASAGAVIVYREPGEVLKGAFVEVGAALAVGTPVYAVGCDEFSFVNHAGVTRCADLGQALALALPTPPSDPAPSGQAED